MRIFNYFFKKIQKKKEISKFKREQLEIKRIEDEAREILDLKGHHDVGKDEFLNRTLTKLFKNNIIKDVNHGHLKLDVIFNDFKICNCWDANKYYGWLSSGQIVDNAGTIIYSWVDQTPSATTMLLIKNSLDSFAESKFNFKSALRENIMATIEKVNDARVIQELLDNIEDYKAFLQKQITKKL